LAGRIADVEHTRAEEHGFVEEEILVKDIPADVVHAGKYIPVVLVHIRSNHRTQGHGCNC
jgi:hypothetical protein